MYFYSAFCACGLFQYVEFFNTFRLKSKLYAVYAVLAGKLHSRQANEVEIFVKFIGKKEGFTNGIKAIGDGFKKAVKAVGDGITNKVNDLKNTFSKENLKKTLEEKVSEIKEGWGNLTGSFTKIFDDIGEKFDEFKKGFNGNVIEYIGEFTLGVDVRYKIFNLLKSIKKNRSDLT